MPRIEETDRCSFTLRPRTGKFKGLSLHEVETRLAANRKRYV